MYQNQSFTVLSFFQKPQFLKNFRNPCWLKSLTSKRMTSTRLRCLPYFFLAGFAKCGTTDTFRKLIQFPLIVPGKHKEIHFWRKKEKYNKSQINKNMEYESVLLA